MSKIIEGIAAWAHINKPSKEHTFKDKTGKKKTIPSRYSVNLILEDSLAEKMKAAGYNIKTVKENLPGIPDSVGKSFVEIKKAACEEDGSLKPAPRCVDSKKLPYQGLIGNGSKIRVKFRPYHYEIFGQEGISAQLQAVQVIDLVEYEDSGPDFDVVEDGFTVDTGKSESLNEDVSDVNLDF